MLEGKVTAGREIEKVGKMVYGEKEFSVAIGAPAAKEVFVRTRKPSS